MISLTEQYKLFSSLINNFIIAVIIFIIGLVVGRLAGNFVKKIFKELEIDKIISGKKSNINELAGNTLSYIIYFFAGVMALTQIGLTTTVLTMISAAVLIIIVLAFILGVKDFIPNFIAGILIKKNNLFEEGSIIEVADVNGKVVNIKLLETEIKSGKDTIFVPNSSITKNKLKIKS